MFRARRPEFRSGSLEAPQALESTGYPQITVSVMCDARRECRAPNSVRNARKLVPSGARFSPERVGSVD